jgi:hypothetical protein
MRATIPVLLILLLLDQAVSVDPVIAGGKPVKKVPEGRLRVVGLEVHKPVEGQANLTFSNRTGLSIHLLASFDREMIIDVNDSASELSLFEDDKGTSMLQPIPGRPMKAATWLVRGYEKMKYDSKGNFLFTIHSRISPLRGAGKVVLKGRVACDLGKDEKKAEWTVASIKERDAQKIGPMTMNADKMFAGFYDHDKPNRIKEVSFFDAKGGKIKATLSYSVGEAGVVDKSYDYGTMYYTDAPYAKGTVTYFAAHETVIIPIDLDVSLGL